MREERSINDEVKDNEVSIYLRNSQKRAHLLKVRR